MISNFRNKAIAGLKVGDTFSVSRTFIKQDVIQFAEISRDYNPVHFDERFAKVKNLEGLICHGLLVASLISEIGGQIGWLASGMTLDFRRPVYVGDTIQCNLVITKIGDRGHAKAKVVCTDKDGLAVLKGIVTGIVPGSQEKQVMKDMIAEGDPTNKILS